MFIQIKLNIINLVPVSALCHDSNHVDEVLRESVKRMDGITVTDKNYEINYSTVYIINFFSNICLSVSYTHLDVYKRQVLVTYCFW